MFNLNEFDIKSLEYGFKKNFIKKPLEIYDNRTDQQKLFHISIPVSRQNKLISQLFFYFKKSQEKPTISREHHEKMMEFSKRYGGKGVSKSYPELFVDKLNQVIDLFIYNEFLELFPLEIRFGKFLENQKWLEDLENYKKTRWPEILEKFDKKYDDSDDFNLFNNAVQEII